MREGRDNDHFGTTNETMWIGKNKASLLVFLHLLLTPSPCHATSSWWQLLLGLLWPQVDNDTSAADCHCITPFEQDLCRFGSTAVCRAFVCYDTDALCDEQALEKQLFYQGCILVNSVMEVWNCQGDDDGSSRRPNAVSCFDDQEGIRATTPPRGNCDPGSCCQANDLCPNERTMHFMSLGYGTDVDPADDESTSCTSSLDYYGDAADCSWLTDGRSNDALVCRDANVAALANNNNVCDVAVTATNDIYDILRYVRQYVQAGDHRDIVFAGPAATIEFQTARALADIALGDDDNGGGGIVDLVYKSLDEKGCFTRENASVHLTGHSLGGFIANVLALKIASEYAEVTLQITTAGEPAGLVEPLHGAAAELPVWKTKVRYVTGQVFPTSNALNGLGVRPYGFYQTYDFVPQILPGVRHLEGEGTTVKFLCESLLPDNRLSYSIAGPEGCAAGRDDVLNDMALFPMEGFLQERSFFGMLLNLILAITKPNLDPELRSAVSVWLSVASEDFREDFIRVLDTHSMRRYMKMLNIVTQGGLQCDMTAWTEQNPLSRTCS